MVLNISNTEDWINNLFNRDFIREEYGEGDFVDAYLDKRDTDPFDSNWTAADKYLAAYCEQSFSKIEMEEIEKNKGKMENLILSKSN